MIYLVEDKGESSICSKDVRSFRNDRTVIWRHKRRLFMHITVGMHRCVRIRAAMMSTYAIK